MGRQTFFLGRLFGVRVGVHVSWLAVYAFMTVVIARGLAGLPVIQAYGLGALCALALFASVVGHEFAHAIVARRFGVQTRAITLFLFGGVSQIGAEPPSATVLCSTDAAVTTRSGAWTRLKVAV